MGPLLADKAGVKSGVERKLGLGYLANIDIPPTVFSYSDQLTQSRDSRTVGGRFDHSISGAPLRFENLAIEVSGLLCRKAFQA